MENRDVNLSTSQQQLLTFTPVEREKKKTIIPNQHPHPLSKGYLAASNAMRSHKHPFSVSTLHSEAR